MNTNESPRRFGGNGRITVLDPARNRRAEASDTAATATAAEVARGVQAALISFVGAAIGVAIGGLLVVIVNIAWWPAPVSPISVVASVAAAVATGLIFGISPARKAAKLRPIEALRTE